MDFGNKIFVSLPIKISMFLKVSVLMEVMKIKDIVVRFNFSLLLNIFEIPTSKT